MCSLVGVFRELECSSEPKDAANVKHSRLAELYNQQNQGFEILDVFRMFRV